MLSSAPAGETAMHVSIGDYLTYLANKGRSSLTVKAAHGDLTGFVTWWEA